MKEENINALSRTIPERVIPIFNKFKQSYNDFLENVKACKNSTGEERKHHLATADKNLNDALNHLMEIIKIAEETNDQTLKNQIKSIMQDVINTRKMVLKT